YVLRAIGARQAHRYFLTAERIDAGRAAALGLVHELVEDEAALDAAVAALVGAILQGGPLAQAAAKDLIRAVAHRPVSDALRDDTARRIAAQRATAEAKEGLCAFLDKRPPGWAPQA
ncbi:MAG: enoyl-CoA hydratase/isomerase family protein, partial [Rhodocyclaceae bacterium]|nr:enoyl-CoA hydratase/isomerase family protein [Rhodocyclaceae bacterium]